MNKVIFNHKVVESANANISIQDRGFVFGDGVYEVIRFYNGVLFKPEEHLVRFERSIKQLDIDFVFDYELMFNEMDYLIKSSGYNSGYIYTQVTRGVAKRDHIYVGKEISEPTYIMYVVQEEERPVKAMTDGIKVFLTEDIRWLRCDIKSLNLLGSVMAKNEAYRRGGKEAVLHRNGYITEGSATNVFIVKNNVLYTHPANNLILNGITRLAVIRAANDLGIKVSETPFMVSMFLEADEAFTTASISEISPIVEVEYDIDGETMVKKMGNGERGTITALLQKKFGEYIG